MMIPCSLGLAVNSSFRPRSTSFKDSRWLMPATAPEVHAVERNPGVEGGHRGLFAHAVTAPTLESSSIR